MTRTELTLNFFVRNIRERTPFSFTRWGDGEAACVIGERGGNCDGHAYFEDLRMDLQTALYESKAYYHGLLAIAVHNKPEFWEYINISDIEWYAGDALLDASCAGLLRPFINALRSVRVAYVGPTKLKMLDKYFPICEFIEVPEKNCYLDKYMTKLRILYCYYFLKPSPDIFLFSAGMLTKVIVDELYAELGKKVSMLDVGSLFDIYGGFVTRSYAKVPNWNDLIFLNTGVFNALS